jgi:DNA invertase Pin-like site-specific DNA recombinase
MSKTLIGYARCSTDRQDLTAQQRALAELGVAADRIYTDRGLTGTHCARPELDQALAAVRRGDTLVVPKLDRLARSVPDARDIADSLVARGVKLAVGGSVYDPTDPMGKMFFNILATFAEFEADLIRLRTRESMAIARAKGKLRGKQPKLSVKQQNELRRSTTAAITRSVTWRNCFRSRVQPYIEHLHARQSFESNLCLNALYFGKKMASQ